MYNYESLLNLSLSKNKLKIVILILAGFNNT